MKTWNHNGEYWYCDNRSLWKRFRQYFIWIGGWEKPNGCGWNFLLELGGATRLSNPFPVSILGHKVTFFSWGLQVRINNAYFVLTWRKNDRESYISKDGTPSRAHCWFLNPPHEVVNEANERKK